MYKFTYYQQQLKLLNHLIEKLLQLNQSLAGYQTLEYHAEGKGGGVVRMEWGVE